MVTPGRLSLGDLVEFTCDVRLSCRRKIQQFRKGDRGRITEIVEERVLGTLYRVFVRRSRDPLIGLTHCGTLILRPVSAIDRLAEIKP